MSRMPKTKQAIRGNLDNLVVIAIVAVSIMVAPLINRITDTRAWRDLTGQTPFSDVQILSATATSLEVMVSGTLTKTRDCPTIGRAIASIIKDGEAFPARFASREPEEMPMSRPRMGVPQAFGPWVITSPVAYPDEARMFRTHDCGGKIITSEVFRIPWPEVSQ